MFLAEPRKAAEAKCFYSSSEFFIGSGSSKAISIPARAWLQQCGGHHRGGDRSALCPCPTKRSPGSRGGTVARCHHPQLTRAQLQSAPAVLHPSIVARAGIGDVPLSLAGSGRVAKRSREMCRDLTVHDFPNAPGSVAALGSPNHVCGFWQSLRRSVFPNRGSWAVVPSVEKGISSICVP